MKRRFIQRNPWPVSVALVLVLVASGAAQSGVSEGGPYRSTAQGMVSLCGKLGEPEGRYRMEAAAGAVSGSSHSPTYSNASGIIPRRPSPIALEVNADQLSVAEGTHVGVSADVKYDDATRGPVAGEDVAWRAQQGPVTLDRYGVITAGRVFEATSALVVGVFQGCVAAAPLTVVNVDPDDFDLYAFDGLDDAWQVSWFGIGNVRAAPGTDADGDGQDNRFEFVAGLNPTQHKSAFAVSVYADENVHVRFGPLVAGRSYTILSSPSLAPGSWSPLSTFEEVDSGNERIVTDKAEKGSQRFYRVNITAP